MFIVSSISPDRLSHVRIYSSACIEGASGEKDMAGSPKNVPDGRRRSHRGRYSPRQRLAGFHEQNHGAIVGRRHGRGKDNRRKKSELYKSENDR